MFDTRNTDRISKLSIIWISKGAAIEQDLQRRRFDSFIPKRPAHMKLIDQPHRIFIRKRKKANIPCQYIQTIIGTKMEG